MKPPASKPSACSALLWTGLLLLATACTGTRGGGDVSSPQDTLSRTARLEGILSILAADSLEGRMTGTRGSAEAADFIAGELESSGLEPAFDRSFFQPVPMVEATDARGRQRLFLEGDESTQGLEVLQEVVDVNVGGILWGTDPERGQEIIVVSAHFDHLGRRPPRPGTPAEAEGDSIYNGADDDASGVAAVLEVAHSMAQDGPGKRTVLFLLVTGEEMGLLGSRWYVEHPVFPLEETVADLNVEMLGRPGPIYEGAGTGWLTGFERSTLGPILVSDGLEVKPDPFPDRGLFFGSDNASFAMAGIPAHTLSSSDLHEDYHTPDDEVDRIDFQSMTQVVETLIQAVRVLADGATPEWVEGGRPEPRGGTS
ncbi:MAG: M20/M25/M40 family metallo-hydrolase [Gemmatimonadota bacterium]|jgi:hypothetical protein